MPARITGGLVYEVRINGLDQLVNILKKTPVAVQKKGLRKAVGAGARIVRDAARNKYRRVDRQVTAATIYKNIVSQSAPKTARQVDGVVYRVGVIGGARRHKHVKSGLGTAHTIGASNYPGGDTWYWRFIEFGVPTHGIIPRPFMLKSLEENVQKATDTIAGTFSNELDEYFARNQIRSGR